MLSTLIFISLLGLSSAKCGFPNGTDTNIVWWQGPTNGNVQFTELNPVDAKGNAIYPIHLTAPLYVQTHIINKQNDFVAGKLMQSIKIYQYGGWAGCSWSEVPTFGLLDNLDACTNGVKCPVNMGEKDMIVTIDFTKYKACHPSLGYTMLKSVEEIINSFQNIISLLANDAPYQLEMKLTDTTSNTYVTLVTQARAFTK